MPGHRCKPKFQCLVLEQLELDDDVIEEDSRECSVEEEC